MDGNPTEIDWESLAYQIVFEARDEFRSPRNNI